MTDKLELYIEEMVLSGFPPLEGCRIRQAVEQHLRELIAGNGVPESLTRSSRVSCLDGGEFQPLPEMGAGDIGARIAQRVYTSLAGSTNSKGEKRP